MEPIDSRISPSRSFSSTYFYNISVQIKINIGGITTPLPLIFPYPVKNSLFSGSDNSSFFSLSIVITQCATKHPTQNHVLFFFQTSSSVMPLCMQISLYVLKDIMKSLILCVFFWSIPSDFCFLLKNFLLRLKNCQSQQGLIVGTKVQKSRCDYLRR